jgi:hypothetical protein
VLVINARHWANELKKGAASLIVLAARQQASNNAICGCIEPSKAFSHQAPLATKTVRYPTSPISSSRMSAFANTN